MPVKFLTVSQALDYFEQLDSGVYSDDPEIVCLPPYPGIVIAEEDVTENNVCDDLPRDTSGEFELSKSKVNKEVCDLLIKKRK